LGFPEQPKEQAGHCGVASLPTGVGGKKVFPICPRQELFAVRRIPQKE